LIKEKPTLLETFSFIFYFPSALIGPSFEFRDFIKFIRLEDEYKHIPWKKANRAALKDFVLALLLVFTKVQLSPNFSTLYCGTEEFIQHNIFYKYFYMVFAMVVMRSTYYAGWKISQAGMNFCGLSYNKKKSADEEHHDSFDKVDICNLEVIELDINPRIRIQYWNRTVHLWLKYYLFLRLLNIDRKPFKNNKALASLLTFLISAIWHGFYPVYYVFFFEYYMIEQISTYLEDEYDLFNKIEKWSFLPKLAYRIFLMSVVNYFGLAFSILTLRANWNYYKAFHFVPLLSLIGAWVYTKIAKKI
jgi:lysophospholipid acyltransferase